MSENQNQNQSQSAQSPESESSRSPVEVRQLNFGNNSEQAEQSPQAEQAPQADTKQNETVTERFIEQAPKPSKPSKVKVGYGKDRESAFRKVSQKRKRQPINAGLLAKKKEAESAAPAVPAIPVNPAPPESTVLPEPANAPEPVASSEPIEPVEPVHSPESASSTPESTPISSTATPETVAASDQGNNSPTNNSIDETIDNGVPIDSAEGSAAIQDLIAAAQGIAPVADFKAGSTPAENKEAPAPKVKAKKKSKSKQKTNQPEQPEPTNKDKEVAVDAEEKPADEGGIRFTDLKLRAEVQKAVESAGYDRPTPIQAEIIPHVLAGRDIVAQSQTGTGKTAAFALPILSNIKPRTGKPQVLVLAPTRELAIQVARMFSIYGGEIDGFGVAAIYGGQDYEPQLRQLRSGVQVVVGTPGRVIDHIKRGTLDLSQLDCLVLDEADEMLNMGFLDDVKFVLEQTPAQRQIALFSATLPAPIRNIAEKYLNDPAKVTIAKKTMTADSIRQRAVLVSQREKVDLLIRFLEAEESDGVIVFTRTRESTTVVAEQLVRAGLNAVALNGDVAQKMRERTIQRLKSGKFNILVATDVAARGLDVQRISHVFNFDLPEGSETYVHRVGRTGRAGRKGEAIIFLTHSQKHKLRHIEKATRQKIEIVEAPSIDAINKMRVARFKEKIGQVIESEDLNFYKTMLADYAENSGQPYELIAAAVAHIRKDGRDFLMKPRPKRERGERGDRGERRNKPGRRGAKYEGGPKPGMTRYRIGVGKRDGVRVGNIVGAVANEGGIDGQSIGPILIHQSYSTIDLPSDLPRDVTNTLKSTRVGGRPLNLGPAREDSGKSSEGYRGGGKRRASRGNDKPRSGKGRTFKSSRRKEGGAGGDSDQSRSSKSYVRSKGKGGAKNKKRAKSSRDN